MNEEPKVPAPPDAEKPKDPKAAIKELIDALLKPPTIEDLMRRQIDDGKRLHRIEQMLAERGDPSTNWAPHFNRVADEVLRIERDELKALHDHEQKRVGEQIRVLQRDVGAQLDCIVRLEKRVHNLSAWKWAAFVNMGVTLAAAAALIAKALAS